MSEPNAYNNYYEQNGPVSVLLKITFGGYEISLIGLLATVSSTNLAMSRKFMVRIKDVSVVPAHSPVQY